MGLLRVLIALLCCFTAAPVQGWICSLKLQGVLDAPVELSIAQASMACVPETPQESNTILTADVVESLLPHQPNFTGKCSTALYPHRLWLLCKHDPDRQHSTYSSYGHSESRVHSFVLMQGSCFKGASLMKTLQA